MKKEIFEKYCWNCKYLGLNNIDKKNLNSYCCNCDRSYGVSILNDNFEAPKNCPYFLEIILEDNVSKRREI